MATKASTKVAETRALIADLKRQLDRAEAKLEAYLEFDDEGAGDPARHKPVENTPPKTRHSAKTSKGRFKPGVVSAAWQASLNNLKRHPSFTTDDIVRELAAHGYEPPRPIIRGRLSELAQSGKIKRIADGQFQFPVPAKAVAA